MYPVEIKEFEISAQIILLLYAVVEKCGQATLSTHFSMLIYLCFLLML